MVMIAICNPELYLWYFNCGDPGLINDDLDILDRNTIVRRNSFLFSDLSEVEDDDGNVQKILG